MKLTREQSQGVSLKQVYAVGHKDGYLQAVADDGVATKPQTLEQYFSREATPSRNSPAGNTMVRILVKFPAMSFEDARSKALELLNLAAKSRVYRGPVVLSAVQPAERQERMARVFSRPASSQEASKTSIPGVSRYDVTQESRSLGGESLSASAQALETAARAISAPMKRLFWFIELLTPPALVLLIAVSLFNNPTKAQTGGSCTGGCLQGTSINLILKGTPGKIGIGYAGILTPSGGNSSNGYSFTFVSGTLPAGTSLASCTHVASCVISGTPTTQNAYTFHIQVTDTAGNTGPSGGFVFTVGVASLSSTAFTSASGYALAVGGTAQGICTGTWSDSTMNNLSNLPGTTWASSTSADVSVSLTGLFTGVLAGNSNGSCTFATVSSPGVGFTVASGTVVVATTSLPNGQINQVYPESPNAAVVLTATGGTPPYTFALFAGSLPAGVTLASNGALTGTATASGSFSPQFKATDSASNVSAAVTLSLTIASLSTVSVDCTATPGCRAMNQGQQLQFFATGHYSDSSTADVTNQVVGGGGTQAVAQNASNTGGGISTLTISVTNGKLAAPTAANSNLYLSLREGASSTVTWTITDSASQTWTQVGTCANTYNGSGDALCWYKKDQSASINSVTAADGLGASGMDMVLYEVLNGATSSNDVLGTNVNQTGALSSIASGNITTTNPNDILLFAVALCNSNTLAAASPYSFGANGAASARLAVGYRLVTSVQTNTNTSGTWTPGTSCAGGLFGSFKGSATQTGWQESDTSGTNIATVSAGLVQAANAGSASISATASGVTGSVTITVTASAITALNISPLQANIPVGGQQTYTCKDQNGNVVTNSVFFSVQNPANPPVVTQQGSGVGAATFVGAAQGSAQIVCHQ